MTFNFRPSAPRVWMLLKMLFAAAKFTAFLMGNRGAGSLFGDADPKIFHQFEPFGATQFEERCKFRFHPDRNINWQIRFASVETRRFYRETRINLAFLGIIRNLTPNHFHIMSQKV